MEGHPPHRGVAEVRSPGRRASDKKGKGEMHDDDATESDDNESKKKRKHHKQDHEGKHKRKGLVGKVLQHTILHIISNMW